MVYDEGNRRRYFNAAAIRRAGVPWEQLRGRTWSGTGDFEYAYVRGMARGEPVGIAMTREVTSKRFGQPQAEALIHIALNYRVERPLQQTLDDLAGAITKGTDAGAGMIAAISGTPPQVTAGGASFPTTDEFWREVERTWRSPAAAAGIQAFTQGKPIVTRLPTNHRSDDSFPPGIRHHLPPREPWAFSVTMPLVWRGQSLGALTAKFPEGREPDESALAFLGAVADQAAVVIANAQLFKEAQTRAALKERQRLARELHDSVSQALYGIGLGARTARALAERTPAEALAPLNYVLELTETAFAEMRALIFELRPDSLAREGLNAALEGQIMAMRARHGLSIEFLGGLEPSLALQSKEALYRIAIEALHNVIKHAQAGKAIVRLAEDADGVSVTVVDDGAGFDTSQEFPGHFGLHSMRQRAEAAGGELRITSRPREGTTIVAALPLRV